MTVRPWKVVLGIACIPALYVLGAWGLLITMFFKGRQFYQPLILVVAISLGIFALLWAFGIFSTKVRVTALLSFLLVCILAVAGYEIMRGLSLLPTGAGLF